MARTGKRTASKLIEQVQTGMRVVDVDGQPVGPVEYVQMGDPEAATTRGAEMPLPPTLRFVDAIADRFAEPEVPEPLRSRLLIQGFVKVDGPGPALLDTDLYVSANAIASVRDGTVVLSLSKRDMVVEGLGLEPGVGATTVPVGALWWIVEHPL